MYNKKLISMLLFIFFMLSCGDADRNPVHPVTTALPDVNSIETKLPEKPGYQTFNLNCLICHSSRYIISQPDLPEKTWTAIVTKMQKTFGAPVADSSAKEIVQYLVSIKGKE